MMMPRAGDSGSIHGWRIPNKPPQVTANPVFTALRRMGRRVNGGLLPDCRRPWKSSVKRKREFFGRAQESARCDDRDSFLRTSASRRVVPASPCRTGHPFAVSSSEEPSQMIEFVFSASPETIRSEPPEFDPSPSRQSAGPGGLRVHESRCFAFPFLRKLFRQPPCG